MQSARPRLNVEYIQGVTVVTFADKSLLEDVVLHEVNEELNRLVDEQGATRLVLDFRDVNFMSSTMMAHLVQLLRKIKKGPGFLKLCGFIPSLYGAFQTAHLDRLFEIYPDVHSALDSI